MKLALITAVLMTMATLAWLAAAVMLSTAGEASIMNWLVVAIFAVLAVYYWRAYLRAKNTQPSGTE